MDNYKNIKISDLEIKTRGVRKKSLGEEIDTLAEHIKVHGLLNPLVVTENDDGKYEIISGERRFIAINGLNWSEIPCHIISVTDEDDKDAIRLGEKLTFEPISTEDAINLCNDLFNKYRDMKIVSAKTGISKKLIQRYVKYTRLPSIVQDNLGAIAKNPKTAVNLAVEAADALAWSKDSDVPAEKVLELAKEMGEVREARRKRNPKTYKVTLDAKTSDKLERVAEEHANKPEDELIEQISRTIEMIDDDD